METLTIDIGAEIRAMNDKFVTAFKKGDAKNVANLYTEDGMLLPTGSDIVRGRKGIQHFWQAIMDMGVKQVKLETVEAEYQGNTGIELGKYTIIVENEQILDRGKYIVIWKREDGQLKLQKDIWNSNLPTQ
ncbi:YybH family protein [Pontibacter chitinilyticus]|uniref:YybH family protein n=1 Tax=Pontibacter chitinilyticus TaxID=2674989 RepID=UPI00321B3933